MPGARIARVPVTDSGGRWPMAQTEFRDNPRARCGLPSRRCTRRSDCSTPGVRFMPTRCSKMRGRQHARPTMLACGRVLPSLRLAVPTRRAATRKAPTGCFVGRPKRWRHMPARHRTTSTSPSYERGPSNRNIEPCPVCGGPQMTHPVKHRLVLRLAEARDAVGPAGQRCPRGPRRRPKRCAPTNGSAASREVP